MSNIYQMLKVSVKYLRQINSKNNPIRDCIFPIKDLIKRVGSTIFQINISQIQKLLNTHLIRYLIPLPIDLFKYKYIRQKI
jgi:hypothetical protein